MSPLYSEPPKQKEVQLSLSELIQRAIRENAELKMKDQDIRLAESKLDQFNAQKLPTIQSLGIVAPIYKDIGDALTHKEDTNKWGPLFKNMTYVVQPLSGFGRFKHYHETFTKGIEAEKKQKRMKADEIILDVKEYYYSVQMAKEMMAQLIETEEKLEKVIHRIDELLRKESGEVKQEDAYKLKVIAQELKKNKELADRGAKVALAALGYKGGFSPDVRVTLKSEKLDKEPFELRPLNHYQALAMENRPEMAALNSGIEARKALVEAEKKERLPILFAGALLDASDTPDRIRNRQDSPYANDPFNRISGAVGLGFIWNLDFWKVNAKVREYKAEYLKLVHQKEVAETGIPVEVEKAYLEFKEALNNIGHAVKQRADAKKWFMQSVFAWSFGIGDSREVLESVIFKSFSDKNYYDGLLNHNMSIAALSKATGKELLPHLHY